MHLFAVLWNFFSNMLNKTKSSYFVLFHLENIGRGFKQENIRFSKFWMKIWMFYYLPFNTWSSSKRYQFALPCSSTKYYRVSLWSHVPHFRAFQANWKPLLFYKLDLYFAEKILVNLDYFFLFRVRRFNLLTFMTFSSSMW